MSELLLHANHNLQRKAALANAGPLDHVGNVVLVPNKNFDLNQTIFRTLDGVARMIMSAKLGNNKCWHEDAADDINEMFANQCPHLLDGIAIQKTININAPLFEFMTNDCNFACEHADGSFLDHLYFCRDYCATHFTKYTYTPSIGGSDMNNSTTAPTPKSIPVSPRVLFLHSIMGVTTNLFPMSVDKIPRLQELVTPEEFKHIEMFPSIIRLIVDGFKLFDEYDRKRASSPDDPNAAAFKSLSMHRTLDNKEICITEDDFWLQLNFHVIHFCDFLPASNLKALRDEPLIVLFARVYAFLLKWDKLQCQLSFDPETVLGNIFNDTIRERKTYNALVDKVAEDAKLAANGVHDGEGSSKKMKGAHRLWQNSISHLQPSDSQFGLVNSWLATVARNIPCKNKLQTKAVNKWSTEIGHSLEFKYDWVKPWNCNSKGFQFCSNCRQDNRVTTTEIYT